MKSRMTSEDGTTKYTILLQPEQSELLERIAESRRELDVTVNVGDIIEDVVNEYLSKLMCSATTRLDGQPKRPQVLFQFLFGENAEQAYSRLSEGITATLDNAEALLNDAAVLVDAKRNARAHFLVATANEEMGKVYILLDMCRVDLARHQHVLRHLCRSFYSHVLKYVYLDLSAKRYLGIRNLSDVKSHFHVMAQKWWPGSPESGEPDMPHDTVFLREGNLYVDVDAYSNTWTSANFAGVLTGLSDDFVPDLLQAAYKTLEKLRATQKLGLFAPGALRIFNRVTKELLVSKQTTMEKLHDVYKRTGRDLETSLGVSLQDFGKSELHNWPLYWISHK